MKIEIIIVDDHKLFRDGLKSILDDVVDLEIIGTASNGLECLRLLELGCNPDLILLDIRMPLMDGIVTCRIIKKQYSEVNIIALSMYDQLSDAIEMLDAGAMSYLTKNAGKEELIKAIRLAHQNQPYFCDALPDSIKSYPNHIPNIASEDLTKRENEILHLIAKGRTSSEIGKELSISKFTVDTHRKNIHKKLNIHSNVGLIHYALKHTT